MDFRTRNRRVISEINLTPLIDIVFNLLIFFVITSSFSQNAGIDVSLPKASATPTIQDEDNVHIAITPEGQVMYGGRAVSDDELRSSLTDHHKQHPNVTVIIQADEKTGHGLVVKIMDIARTVGFEHLAIATQAP